MMRGTAVSGGQQRRATWNTFAGKPWQVEGREMLPETLSRGFRARWAAGRCHLEHFCGDSVPGGRQRRTPGTLSREYRARWTAKKDTWNGWTAKKDTWNAFAGIPWQVDGREGHLERFRGNTVPGGQQGDAT